VACLPYFPLEKLTYEMSFGVKPLVSPIFEQLTDYREQIQQKRQLIQSDPSYYFQALPGFQLVLEDAAQFLAAQLEESNPNSLDLNGLGQQVADDLLVLDGDLASGFRLLAGQLCFPNGWSLSEKIGQPLMNIHHPVPDFRAKLGSPTQKLHENLKIGRPIWRLNWGIKPTATLDLSMKNSLHLEEQARLVDSENAGERCWFRVERQTLSRLPLTNAILFTIRTYQVAVADLDPQQRRLVLGNLTSAPMAVLQYKGISPFLNPLVSWLKTADAI
jgi:dimethylamine monooxygenase subunit A